MVIKPDDARKKAEESEKNFIRYRAKNLEEQIDLDIRSTMTRYDAPRKYIYSDSSSPNEHLYSKIMEAVMEDYRNAGWEAEYQPEKRGYETRTLITLKVGKDTAPKGKSQVLLASIIEKEVAKREEKEAKIYETAIDNELVSDKKAVWHRISGDMGDEVREMLTKRYSDAGWNVSIKERYDRTRDWRQEKNRYLVFERK